MLGCRLEPLAIELLQCGRQSLGGLRDRILLLAIDRVGLGLGLRLGLDDFHPIAVDGELEIFFRFRQTRIFLLGESAEPVNVGRKTLGQLLLALEGVDYVLKVHEPAAEFMEDGEEGATLHSQIPTGFAGAASEFDDFRADTSPWLEKMPVIREFRRKVLAKRPQSSEEAR